MKLCQIIRVGSEIFTQYTKSWVSTDLLCIKWWSVTEHARTYITLRLKRFDDRGFWLYHLLGKWRCSGGCSVAFFTGWRWTGIMAAVRSCTEGNRLIHSTLTFFPILPRESLASRAYKVSQRLCFQERCHTLLWNRRRWLCQIMATIGLCA